MRFENRFTTDLFQVRRVVRQGDPLSPLLFPLVIEVLPSQIRQEVETTYKRAFLTPLFSLVETLRDI